MQHAQLLVLILLLGACTTQTANKTEYAVDATALLAETSESLILKRPCTSTVTQVCINKATISAIKVSRKTIRTALEAYWAAKDAYTNNPTDLTKSAQDAAAAALTASINQANTLLADPNTQSVLQLLNKA